jgi:hypothetical protein
LAAGTRGIAFRAGWSVQLCALALLLACKVHAQSGPSSTAGPATDAAPITCLPDGNGYLRARLRGSMNSDLDWSNAGTECTGAVRPDGGVRMRFSHVASDKGERLVLVFGIAQLREGKSAKNLRVNLTLFREGSGEFFSTRGDDKCMLDEIAQTPLVGIPHRERSYRVVVRGFCTGPARALTGTGAIYISRFDYAGRVDFGSTDPTSDEALEARRR